MSSQDIIYRYLSVNIFAIFQVWLSLIPPKYTFLSFTWTKLEIMSTSERENRLKAYKNRGKDVDVSYFTVKHHQLHAWHCTWTISSEYRMLFSSLYAPVMWANGLIVVSSLVESYTLLVISHVRLVWRRKIIFVFQVTRPAHGKTPRLQKVFLNFGPKLVVCRIFVKQKPVNRTILSCFHSI